MTSQCDGRRILVVEDEYLVATMLEEILAEAGFVVIGPLPSLAEAMRAADESEIDVALLDVNLAGQHVYPAAEALERRGIPFIFMTGYGWQALPAKFRARPSVSKPFKSARLLDALASVLGQHA